MGAKKIRLGYSLVTKQADNDILQHLFDEDKTTSKKIHTQAASTGVHSSNQVERRLLRRQEPSYFQVDEVNEGSELLHRLNEVLSTVCVKARVSNTDSELPRIEIDDLSASFKHSIS